MNIVSDFDIRISYFYQRASDLIISLLAVSSNIMRYMLNFSGNKIYDIKKERRFIFFVILSLTLFGILMIYESSSIYAFKMSSDTGYFLKKQFVFFIVGLLLFYLTLFIDLDILRRYNKEFLLFTLLLLLMILVIGKRTGGAKRWFHFPWFSFQPSEMLKMSFLLYCSDYFARKEKLITDLKQGLLPFGIVLGITSFLVVLEPDLGTVIFWMIWTLLILFLYGAKSKHLCSLIILGIIFSSLLIVMYPYRFQRMGAYINPFRDAKGTGFQLVQSQIAYGEGGIWGVGLGEGRQKLFFLPAAHTDFVFSIIAEEFGLLGALTIIFMFFIVFQKMFTIAKNTEDKFKSGILWGVIFIFFLEVIINIGVSCGILPTKGLALPFISYGGSNLVTHYVLLGLFFNASRRETVDR